MSILPATFLKNTGNVLLLFVSVHAVTAFLRHQLSYESLAVNNEIQRQDVFNMKKFRD
jgi:hypothetical protein